MPSASLGWLALFFALAVAKTPKFSWGQDKARLYLTIQAQCESNRVVDIRADHFRLSCDGPGGPHELDFVTREDLVPEESKCTSTGKTEVCELTKPDAHFYDRLVEDPKPFKKLMTTDWRVGRSERGDDDDNELDADAFGSHVTVLSPKALNKTLQSRELVVLYLSYRWCTKCQHTREHFGKLARQMKKEAFFGLLDPLDNRYARTLFNPKCDHTCVYHVHRRGEEPYQVKYGYDEAQQLAQLRGFLTPLVSPLATAADVEAFAAAHRTRVIGAFTDTREAGARAFWQAARTFRGNVPFAMASDPVDGVSSARPSIQIFKPNSSAVDFTGDFTSAEQIVRFVNISSLPLVLEHDYELRGKLDGIGLPGLHVWVPEKPAESPLPGIMEDVAKELSGKMYVMRFEDTRHKWMKEEFGADNFAVGIQESFQDNTKRFLLEGPATKETVLQFCQDYLAGKLRPAWKSEPVPTEEWEQGKVKKIVRKTLDSEVSSDRAVLIAFYKTWFAEWPEKQVFWTQMAELLKVVPDLVLGTFELTANRCPKEWFNNTEPGFVTVALLPANGDEQAPAPVAYTGKLKQQPLLAFLKQHVPGVVAAWDGIAAEIARAQEERKAAKRAEKEARKAEEERLATIEKVDISGDGGVLKQVLKEGSGEQPPASSQVQAHYTGKLKDGSVFDSSRERDHPFDFTLGQGNVIKCWDQAFATMKVGEKAVLTCAPEYAYGESGSPPKIPAQATLRFDVELLGFTPAAPPPEAPKDEL